MKEEIKAMKYKITLMDTRIGVVITSNATAINDIDALSALPAPVDVPTSVASTSAALPTTESSDTNAVFGYIHGYMWNPKLKSRDQAEIQANAIKPKWAVDIRFDCSPNRELVKQLLYYLEKKFAGTDMRTRDPPLNTNSRRSDLETDNYTHRRLAYDAYKADIDLKIGQNCSGLIQKSVMSEGESDDDMSLFQPRNEICVAHPSWRSDERVYGRTVESTVPIDLDPALPQWALKYGS
ncbi:hypothetical protein PHYBLDRAFT_150140 [Phycomyces blakesleeanus NRRL 1555(-)]|uniref:Uncharacterized protein n=1 Tax=Phycomyces blakesleeanus (strain ATCC 8743b / DSM 1359 / FGSC 10004 / NBRC 33097 / NRRL 1555) TaxID=763407 RepID=A0A167KP26_PHYB8|nr:hypothetical protein PHYBLDRAFT_150140 [Phycomyces blakesleeanus NRRL 1555(-)]OAD68546.1 hypothetical protein PHYBLDRAFT_150140 [Phycomyces blakesleeanus NRRL 1555(-)]|eukprot:XP_018286586.1 hypothetical protein PHYBLDRAFT_150140 [Phycomyces blakesleeanus NRRL 1555(-)]